MKPDVQAHRDAVAADPDDAALRLALAKALMDAVWYSKDESVWETNYREAKSILESVLSEEPDNAIALVNLGVVYSDQGSHKQALEHYRRVEQLDWTDGNLLYNIGVAMVNLGDEENGRRYLQASAKLDEHPDTVMAYFDPQAH